MALFVRTHWQLLFILIVALILRMWQLGNVPPSLSLDEVSIGWNAYSILKTGADEYGVNTPLLLRAYDDWRPALYVYAVIPFVAVLGLTPLAVRLPSVLLSLVTIILTFELCKVLFPVKKHSLSLGHHAFGVGFFASLLIAISPWHIYLSRLGHEVNLGSVLVVGGMYALLRSLVIEKEQYMMIPGVASLILSMYAYQSQKVVVPVIIAGVSLLFLQTFRKHAVTSAKTAFVGALLIVPLLYISVQPDSLIRFRGTSAFTSDNPIFQADLIQFARAKETGDIVGQALYNRRLTPVKIFLSNYVSHFNPSWLFGGGPKENHKVPNTGLLYPWEAVLVVLGMLTLLLRAPISRGMKGMLLLWLLAAPLPAAITTQAPHAMRSFTAVPVLQVLGAFGIISLKKWHHGVMGMLLVAVLLSLVHFGRQYYDVFPKTHSASFQFALTTAVKYIHARQNNYSTVIISNKNALYQSYMFYLFHTGFDPRYYNELGGTVSGGFDAEHTIGNVQFREIERNEEYSLDTLYVVNVSEVPDGVSPSMEFQELDGTPAIALVETL